ncbi:hypothetical protein IST4116A_01362 [Burkholderia cenocepacia]|nr:hypothetical protein IST4112_01359 [Burkholderia cenocepacia]CAB5097311.1 hypothetical protein IST439_01401 [Burkholderia cenocepacia]CAB5107451.1 hypothetical protein IST4129_01362 [Burkholderia cenocepacia]CAB5134342.1 hypothetical protein IST4131_01356 [Burkholderia cenocepacia]CAB5134621.1 hypothetical protein IST4116A_01362 [Burkholderia cenocepacia]
MRDWFEICAACTPTSSTITPITSPTRLDPDSAKITNDSASSAIASEMIARGPRWSAKRPAYGAASAPAAPTIPNRPAACGPRWNGAPASSSVSTGQNALNAANSAAPVSDASRSPRSSTARCHIEPSSLPYDSVDVGELRGSRSTITTASATSAATDAANTARQPKYSATKPAAVRASRMPSSRPLITVPTAWPRSAGGAISAANGTACCAMVARMPIARLATASTASDGAAAATISAIESPAICSRISPRRSKRSPSGASRNMPAA